MSVTEVHRRKSQHAMFKSGTQHGESAGRTKCAAIDENFLEGSDSAWVAQLVERVLGKDEVTGSIPVPGSRNGLSFRRNCLGFVLHFEASLAVPSGGNSTVESHSSKVMVAGSNPVPRSKVLARPVFSVGLSLRMRAYGEGKI